MSSSTHQPAKLRIIPHSHVAIAGADSGWQGQGGDSPRPPKSTEPTSHELLKLAHALFVKLVSSGLDKAELRGFIKRRYGKLTKFVMTIEELQDFIRLLKLYGTAICSRVTGEFDPPTQIQLDFG